MRESLFLPFDNFIKVNRNLRNVFCLYESRVSIHCAQLKLTVAKSGNLLQLIMLRKVKKLMLVRDSS